MTKTCKVVVDMKKFKLSEKQKEYIKINILAGVISLVLTGLAVLVVTVR